MANYQKQLNNLKNYLKTKGDFEVKIITENHAAVDMLFYEISHPNFVNTYIKTFRNNDDLMKTSFRLEEFIKSVSEKNKLFKEYIDYFESTNRYKIQFLNSETDQLDLIITHIDTNHKYVLKQNYNILQQKKPIYHLSRQVIFKPINSKCKWQDNKNPIMDIKLTVFNRKPNPVELDKAISNELKFDTQVYFEYN